MALNPNIPLATRVPDVGQAIGRGMNMYDQVLGGKQRGRQIDIQEADSARADEKFKLEKIQKIAGLFHASTSRLNSRFRELRASGMSEAEAGSLVNQDYRKIWLPRALAETGFSSAEDAELPEFYNYDEFSAEEKIWGPRAKEHGPPKRDTFKRTNKAGEVEEVTEEWNAETGDWDVVGRVEISKGVKGQTDFGKLTADYRNNLLGATPQENEINYQKALSKSNLKGLDAKQLAVMAEQQGDNYVGASKNYVAVRDAYGRVQASADGTPAGDLSLIFNYMKMLDPGSVVRESEFATAAATGSYGERIQAYVGRILKGTRLEGDQRADFVSKAQDLMNSALSTQKLTRDNYRKIAKRAKLDEDDISDRVVMMALEGKKQAEAGGEGGGSRKIPEALRGMAGLQWSEKRQQYRNLKSGKLYNAQGVEVPQ